ncbi:MAG TPA: class I SAM-dependent methyltransferase [Polyangiaceae bacterium]|nr:class I SAM-dependent methyltransferase [Polyangiaceae bacterium]
MDRARVWPTFRDGWIVHGDADLLAIDKPFGVSSQAVDPERPDDIVTRLKTYLAERGSDPYLGVHQRLDRDTSGVMVFARRRDINVDLAAQFEGRRVRKTYVACVSGWPSGRQRSTTLRDTVAPGPDGRMQIVPARSPRGKEAITDVRVLERFGDRTMLALELRTGRTHQARVQLAHAGAPIAGDLLYGGAPASRLMLHADELSLLHPTSRRPVRFRAPVPAELNRWIQHGHLGDGVYDDATALDGALGRAVERRWALGRSTDFGPDRETTAFRLVNELGDALPRLAVDVYGSWIVAQLYGEDGPWADPARRQRVLDRLDALGFDGVYLKIRPKQANLVDGRRQELAPPFPVRGVAAPDEITILEEGMPLHVRLGDGLSTGLFLDQRDNRRRVRALATGKTVANLFSYTCAFTLAAALGGAASTVSVDASVSALERGRENLARAGVLEDGRHTLVVSDVFTWLSRAAHRRERFDLVILDPPSYSTTRRGRFVAAEDYGALATSALAVLAPEGRLLACTNHRGISRTRFRRILRDALGGSGRKATQMKDLAEPADFPAGPGGEGHMKSVLVTVQ